MLDQINRDMEADQRRESPGSQAPVLLSARPGSTAGSRGSSASSHRSLLSYSPDWLWDGYGNWSSYTEDTEFWVSRIPTADPTTTAIREEQRSIRSTNTIQLCKHCDHPMLEMFWRIAWSITWLNFAGQF